jgi:hypothetical protein
MQGDRRTLSCVAVAAMVSVLSLPAMLGAQSVVAAQPVSVALISQSTWIDSTGMAHCVGEVKNTGSSTALFVGIDLNLESASNSILGTDSTFALVEPLTPGTKSGYVAGNISASTGFTHCVVSKVSGQSGGSPNYNFATQITNVFIDSVGTHYVGTVTNQNLTTADSVRVNFTFYDGSGGTNDADSTFVQSGSSAALTPGQTASFEEVHLSGSPTATSYAALTTSTTQPAVPRPFVPHNVGAPQVAVTPDGSQQLVFWKDTATNGLAEAWYTLGSWHGPVGFGQLGALTSTPGVAVTKDGSQQLVFWQGAGSTLWEAWYTLGAWYGPVDWRGSASCLFSC